MTSSDPTCGAAEFAPLRATTSTTHRPIDPLAFDWIRLVFARSGSAIVLSEFGERPIKIGDVVLLSSNVLFGIEPEGHLTLTTVYADADYVIDQVFWRFAGLLADRLDALGFAEAMYTEPAQILRLGEDRAGQLMPWLDELVALSLDGGFIRHFFRMQALWFSIAHVIGPFIKVSPIRLSPTQRATACPTQPRHRRFAPLRQEARRGAELLRADPVRRWSVTDLANELHVSKSQVGRIFVDAFGKSPIAYLTMLRTERMAGLLRTTDAPIAVIANEVGWRDPDFAARQFRRSVGMTPRRYRAMSQRRAADGSG